MAPSVSDHTELTTTTGHAMSEAKWLDVHFEVARKEYEAMIRDAGLQPGWHVLDAGCGGGSFLPLMSELVGPTGKITALDLAPENVAVVRERIADGHFACPVEAYEGSILSLPFEDDALDAIWCSNVVQYLTEAEFHQAAAEFLRVLRPGGLLAIKDYDVTPYLLGPLEPELIWRWLAARRQYEQVVGAQHALCFRKWLSTAGFTVGTHKTYVDEDQHPLTEHQRALLRGGLRFFASLAEELPDLSAEDKKIWRRRVADIDAPEHIIHEADFYMRRAYALVLASVPS